MGTSRQLSHKNEQSADESGFSLLEVLVALLILAATAVIFINGLMTSSIAVQAADEKTAAESLARSQMEWVKSSDYSYNATSYTLAPVMDASDYQNLSANITAAALHDPDDGIQKYPCHA